MTLAEKQQSMIEAVNALGDCFDQYSYLLVKSQELPEMPPEKKTPDALVPGCQSEVWLYISDENGVLHMEADSDTLILRGVLRLLQELLEGEPVAEVKALEVRLFSETELAATFSSDRNTGLRSILRRIQLPA